MDNGKQSNRGAERLDCTSPDRTVSLGETNTYPALAFFSTFFWKHVRTRQDRVDTYLVTSSAFGMCAKSMPV